MGFVSPIATCMGICESKQSAAILLHQIIFHSKLTIPIGGRHWIARSQKYWQLNTGLSPKRVKTAVSYLKSKKIIVCYLYNSMHIACSHYRLNRILADLVPIFCKEAQEEIFFGGSLPPWDNHKEGDKIQYPNELHDALYANWEYARNMNDLLPPYGQKWETGTEPNSPYYEEHIGL